MALATVARGPDDASTMRTLFPPWTNTAFRVALAGAALAPIAGVALLMLYARSPLHDDLARPVVQPVDFDHRHQVVDDGIDCRYCHSIVESSSSAGVPSPAVCMSCHSQIWNKSPILDPVRHAYFTGEPLGWKRVHRLPDFVYFDHSIHAAKGVGCESCHGRVDRMAAIQKVEPLTMGFCLDCHRDPAPRLRPRDAVTLMGWKPVGDPRLLGEELESRYDVHTRTSCTACHR